MDGNSLALLALIAVLLATATGVSVYIYYGRVIMRSRAAGTPVALRRMVEMTFSGVNAYNVVIGYLDLQKAGIDISLDTLESFARRDRNLLATTRKLIDSKKRNDSTVMDSMLRKIQGA